MKRLLLISLTGLCLLGLTPLGAADPEDQAIAVLRSEAKAPAKEAACLHLKQSGTARAVPALVTLLADPALAQWGLDALETLPAPEAGVALRKALGTTSGATQAGVIHALGQRRDPAAVPDLIPLLADRGSMGAVAAVQALGRIGGDTALAALRQALPGFSGPVRLAALDALLAVADQWRADGQVAQARGLYQDLRTLKEPVQVHGAAFRGAVSCAEEQAGALLAQALTGPDAAEQALAVQLVRELPQPEVTARVTAILGEVPPPLQVALLEALAQRGDPAAAGAVIRSLDHSEVSVRVAALNALGELGDASHLPRVVERTVAGTPTERDAARRALISLRRGDVFTALLAGLNGASPESQIELVQAIARRGDPGAAARLLALVGSAAPGVRPAVLRALERLAGDPEAAGLLALMVGGTSDELRASAQAAFIAAGLRSAHPERFAQPALEALNRASVPGRKSLIEAVGQIGGPGVTEALRAAVRDPNPELADTALRTMADYGALDTLPDLLKLAQEAPNEVARTLALRGYWRLVETLGERPAAEQMAAIQAGLQVARTPEGLKLGFARLGSLSTPEALALARSYLTVAGVQEEAGLTCLQIAGRLPYEHRVVGEQTLRNLAQAGSSDGLRAQAQALLARAEEHAGYLMPWEVSGPYRQAGKEAGQLFDVLFPPEQAESAATVWRPLPVAGSWLDVWMADLAAAAGGDHCVLYLRTRVFSPVTQEVTLDIGTDDGIKLWVNGKLVHANNAVRGFTPGADHARATLREGGNDFLAKITQHTAGCSAAIRLRQPDGRAVSGLRVETSR